MKVGDRVEMSPMWKFNTAKGAITKITSTYVIVKWDETPGEWHYTEEQAKKLRIIDEEG